MILHENIAIKGVLNVIYPAKCMFCKTHISSYSEYNICGNCLANLPYTKDSGCFETLGKSAYLIAPLMYEGNIKRAIKDLKFHSKFENAKLFGLLICGYLRRNTQAMNADIIVNVPLSKKSLLRRGFNQTQLIAETLSQAINIALDDKALVKIRETKRQSSLVSFAMRAKNVLGAYKCTKDMSGKTVLLIDDVYTSGMTMYNCTKALIAKGAAKVICVAAANAHKELGYSTHDYKASKLIFR